MNDTFEMPVAQGSGLGSFGSPFEFQYKGEVGRWARVRIMSLNLTSINGKKPHGRELSTRWVPDVKHVPKENEKRKQVCVYDNGDPELMSLLCETEAGPRPLSGFESKPVWRIPVFVYESFDPKTNTTTQVNKLRYIEIGPGLKKDIMGLPTSDKINISKHKEYLRFDPMTGLPNYDVNIEVVKGSGAYNNYVVRPLIYDEDGRILDEVKDGGVNFFAVDKGDLIGYKDEIFEDWGKVVDDIHKVAETSAIRGRIEYTLATGGSISARPELTITEDAVDEDPGMDVGVETTTSASAQKGGRKKKEAPATETSGVPVMTDAPADVDDGDDYEN